MMAQNSPKLDSGATIAPKARPGHSQIYVSSMRAADLKEIAPQPYQCGFMDDFSDAVLTGLAETVRTKEGEILACFGITSQHVAWSVLSVGFRPYARGVLSAMGQLLDLCVEKVHTLVEVSCAPCATMIRMLGFEESQEIKTMVDGRVFKIWTRERR